MVAPTLARFTANITALNTLTAASHDDSGMTELVLLEPNQILDIVNSPDPASGNRYVIQIWKNMKDTGKRLYSDAMSPASAGRIAIGPIDISPGKLQFKVMQPAGTAANYSFVVKFLKDVV
jgi:hypothetical protein